jgi:selenocysteine-specific elongation factor
LREGHLVIGVIGHVDHGKTALVRALTGMETDRLEEEKRRGISIALGFAHLKVGPDTTVDLIDMPGHERFVRTMISGATGMDAVMLVVAANEGVAPQTVEHVNIAALLGLRRAVICISKIDLVAPEEARRVADDASRLLVSSGLDPLPPVMTSAHQQTGIDDLRRTLEGLSENQPPRAADGSAFLPIDRAFSIAGHGPVVTGTLRGAAVSVGDSMELFPSRRSVRVRSLQVHGARVETALPGQRVALNLRDIEIGELERGMALVAPDALELSDWLTISIRAVEGAPPLKNAMALRALLGTGEFDARLRLMDRDVLEPGESGLAQLHFRGPVAIPAREHVVLRLLSPSQTVAGGTILEAGTRRQRRKCPQVLRRLEDLRSLPPVTMIAAEVQRLGVAGTTLRHLSRLSSLSTLRIAALLRGLPVLVTRTGSVVWQADMDDLLSRIPSLLVPHAAGLSREELSSALAGIGTAVLEAALGYLRTRGAVAERGGQLRVPRPDVDRSRAHNESLRAVQIAEALRRAGLTPPSPSAIVTDPQSKRAVDRLLREGVVVRAVDSAKGREILFHQDAIADARRRLAPLLADAPGMLVTEIGEALGISRKYSMPLLHHLDAIRFTHRIADRRVRAGAI